MVNCRICKQKIREIVNLGKISLVGNFLKKRLKQKKYKISLNYCISCKHVQISERLNPDLLFKHYLWETGVSTSNIKILTNFLLKLKKFGINKKSKIIEIASNDGSFIKILKKKFSSQVIGIDPAQNLAKKANQQKIFTINDYFNFNFSKKIKNKFSKFNFIFARNVIAHVKNPNEIFKGAENLLDDNGIFVVEVPHLLNILNQNQYDNIFHEHNGFHSLKSISDLCKLNNMKIFDVDIINSQGGSIRCYISKINSKKTISIKVKKILNLEKKSKIFSNQKLKNFKHKIITHSKNLYNLLSKLRKKGKKISIYGASGKGQALMQFSKIDKELIDYVFDKSKLKQGHFTPGTNIKVRDPKNISRKDIDYLLILSWNIKKEIIEQEKKFSKMGGKFIVPFPKPKIIN